MVIICKGTFSAELDEVVGQMVSAARLTSSAFEGRSISIKNTAGYLVRFGKNVHLYLWAIFSSAPDGRLQKTRGLEEIGRLH